MRTAVVSSTSMRRCPIRSIAADHYRDDGSCVCRDPSKPRRDDPVTTTPTEANYLDPSAVAAELGLKSVATVYTYKTKGILPDPDGPTFGITPTWLPETIAAFKASRPGRGKGGGRPRKQATT